MDHFHILSQAIISFVCRRSLNPKYRYLKTYVRIFFLNAQFWFHWSLEWENGTSTKYINSLSMTVLYDHCHWGFLLMVHVTKTKKKKGRRRGDTCLINVLTLILYLYLQLTHTKLVWSREVNSQFNYPEVKLHFPFSSSWQGYEIVSRCNSIRQIFGVW